MYTGQDLDPGVLKRRIWIWTKIFRIRNITHITEGFNLDLPITFVMTKYLIS
jgi:hypothetical protein